jgi:hypothetical protein
MAFQLSACLSLASFTEVKTRRMFSVCQYKDHSLCHKDD